MFDALQSFSTARRAWKVRCGGAYALPAKIEWTTLRLFASAHALQSSVLLRPDDSETLWLHVSLLPLLEWRTGPPSMQGARPLGAQLTFRQPGYLRDTSPFSKSFWASREAPPLSIAQPPHG